MAAKPSGPSQTAGAQAAPEIVAKIFRSWHSGCGDSDESRFNHRMEMYASIDAVTTRYNRTHGSVDARRPGQIHMGMQVKKIALNMDYTPIFATEWTDTNGIDPAIFYVAGKKLGKLKFGADATVATLADVATGAAIHDDGSGVPYLYTSYGGVVGTSTKIQRMNRAQTVTQATDDVVAAQLLSLNGKMYRTIQPTSGTAVCQVSTLPYGFDAFTLANWGAGTTVGFAGTAINVLTSCRQAPVAIKPEGIFAYNADIDQWVNYTPSWESYKHGDNGKGAFSLGDSLLVPMGDGGAVIFDGTSVRPFDPGGLASTPNLHTTKTAFTAMAALRHHVAASTKSASKRSAMGNSLRFLSTVDDITFTDSSSAVRDSSLTTGWTITTGNAALKVYIGWDRPFCTFSFENNGANTNASTMTVKFGTGAGTWSGVSVMDGTSLASATLGQNGDVVLKADPMQSGWVKTTVDSISAYWLQLTFSASLNGGTWENCQISPLYPSIDGTNFPLDGLDKSGAFPHVLVGWEDTAPVWHDLYSLSEPDNIGAVLFPNIGGSSINKSRNLLAIGRFNAWEILVADDDRAGTMDAPVLNGVGLIEGPSFVPAEGQLVRLKTIKITGQHSDPNWKLFFYYTWDSGKPWSKASTETVLPAVQDFGIVPENRGYRFRWAIGWANSNGAGEALSQPRVNEIEATFEAVNMPLDTVTERPTQIPPRI